VHPYISYCESVAAAIRYGSEHGKVVVVASQPRLAVDRPAELHTLQQQMLAKMMAEHFSNDPRVVWADLSTAVDLRSTDVTFDAMHLKPAANAAIAEALIAPVTRALGETGPK
jgi:hypothetical protein